MTIYGQPLYSLKERHCCVKKKKKKKKKDKLHDQARPNQTSFSYEMESNRADGKKHEIAPVEKSSKSRRRRKILLNARAPS